MCYMHFSKLDCYHLKKKKSNQLLNASSPLGKLSQLHIYWNAGPRVADALFTFSEMRNRNLRGYTALSMTESVAFCSFTSMDRPVKAEERCPSFSNKIRSKEKRSNHEWEGGVVWLFIQHSHPSCPSRLPHWLGAALLLSLPSTHEALSNQSIGLWLGWYSH